MASLIRETRNRKGIHNYRIQFEDKRGVRRSISLGRVSKRSAETVKGKIEELVSCSITGDPFSVGLSQWISELGDDLSNKIAERELIPKRICSTLERFLDQFIERKKSTSKSSTLTTYKNVKRNLIKFFCAEMPLQEISTADSDDFRIWLRDVESLSENTIRRRCGIARQMFREAIRRGLISSNPFEGQSVAIKENKSREYFISPQEAILVLDACPSQRWRTIFALCRWGGLRCPSEVTALRWDDIDWERNRMLVRSPKTEHHDGKAHRFVPLFPEVQRELLDLQELPENDSEFVIGTNNKSEAYLRTMMTKIIKRAKISIWPKLFHNLRASRETELLSKYPIHVVCDWIGNSPAIAMKHYTQTLDSDFENAAAWDSIQNCVHIACRNFPNDAETAGNESGRNSEKPEFFAVSPKNTGEVIGRLELIVGEEETEPEIELRVWPDENKGETIEEIADAILGCISGCNVDRDDLIDQLAIA